MRLLYFKRCWFPLSLYIIKCNKYGNKTTYDLGRLLKPNYQWLKYISLLFCNRKFVIECSIGISTFVNRHIDV